jgi:sulfate-transporting ATPase
MSTKIIYSMMGVGKIYPPNKQVLRDISLSYFYGAKIGVLGLNGSGKSTLLRIMAGVEKDYVGETMLAPGFTVGLLEQEPQLDNGQNGARSGRGGRPGGRGRAARVR